MRVVFLLVTAAVAVLLDLTLGPGLRAFGAQPSLTVAVVTVWAVLRRRQEAMVLAPAAGLMLGLLGNQPLGAAVMALAFVVLLGTLRDPNVAEGRFRATLAIAAAGSAAYVVLIAIATLLTGRRLPAPDVITRAVAGTVLLTIPLAAVLYWPVARAAWQPRIRGQFRRY